MKKLIINCIFILYAVSLFGQTDTLFWFVAPEVSAHTNSYDLPIVFRISTLNQGATIKIEQPANPYFTQIIFDMEANISKTIDLSSFVDLLENRPANQILNKGIKISSTEKINVYYEVVSSYCNCNPDVFALKGRNALGTSFYTPFQNILYNRSNFTPLPFSAFDIVATENNTTVTILPKNDIVGHTAGIPFNINLNKGQTYSARAISQEGELHLHGSKVTSDKAIAITIVDDLLDATIYGGCADLTGDQIVPVNKTGKEYIVTKGLLDGPDRVFIVGTKDNTQLWIGGSNAINLNSGQTRVVELYDPSVYIVASENVYVMQLSGHGCEVGTALIPSIVGTGSDQISFTRSVDEDLQLLILVKSGHEGNFLLDNVPGLISPSLFHDVPFVNGTWKSASISITNIQVPVGQTGIISNSAGRFHMGFIHGGEHGGCRFGYFSDYTLFKCMITANETEFCQGETLILTANEVPNAMYEWSGPEGYTNNGIRIEIPNLSLTKSGYYFLNGSIDGIQMESDSIYITVHPFPANLGESTGNPQSLQDSLIAYYPFNGNANDESGNDYDGSIFGAVPVIDRFGEAYHAYHFNGSTDYITADRPYLSEFTASIWVKLDGYQCFSGMIDAYDLSWELVMDCQSPGKFVTFASWDEDGVNYSVNVSNIQLPLNSWHHIVLTYKDNICKFYLNGNISDSLEVTSFNPVSGSFYFGSSKSGTDQFLYGDLDDIRIYSRATTAEEVLCLFKGDCNNKILSANLQNDHLCSGSSTFLSLFNAQSGISYQLFKENIEYGNYQIGNGDTLIFPLNNLSETSSFTIQATDTATGCAITLDSTFIVHVPEIDANLEAELKNDSICPEGSTSIDLMNSQPSIEYQLISNGVEYGSPRFGNGEMLSFPISGLFQATPFIIQATDTATTCSILLDSTFIVHISELDENINAELRNDSICPGGSTSIDLMNSQPGIEYQLISNGVDYGSPLIGNGGVLPFPINGLYEVASFNIYATEIATSCSIMLDSTFIVHVSEVYAKVSVELSSFIVPATAHLSSQSQGADIYKWYLDGILFGNTPESQVIINTPGEHELVLFIQSSPPAYCTDADTLRIILTETTENEVIINIPSSFTPNSDNLNDFFEFDLKGIESYSVWIKDSWGRLINEFDQSIGKWDGMTKLGKEALAGPYYYHFKANDSMARPHERNGIVYLIRDLIELSPNPVKQNVKVNMKGQLSGNKTIHIISIQGVVLLKENFDAEVFEIDLSHLKSGIYYMQISNKEDMKSLKFIKD